MAGKYLQYGRKLARIFDQLNRKERLNKYNYILLKWTKIKEVNGKDDYQKFKEDK